MCIVLSRKQVIINFFYKYTKLKVHDFSPLHQHLTNKKLTTIFINIVWFIQVSSQVRKILIIVLSIISVYYNFILSLGQIIFDYSIFSIPEAFIKVQLQSYISQYNIIIINIYFFTTVFIYTIIFTI